MRGKHLIVDLKTDVKIDTIEDVEPLMKQIIAVGNLNVIDKNKYQFKPHGATLLYLLAESHLSIHTYPENKYVAIDLYCCNPNINFELIIEIINKYFNTNLKSNIFNR